MFTFKLSLLNTERKSNRSLETFAPVNDIQESTKKSAENTAKEKGLDSHVTTNEHLSAEVLWSIKVVLAHYSFKSCEDIAQTFQRMFPDSDIAKKFTCGEKKCAYITTFGIAPYFQQTLLDKMKKIDGYVLLFDESSNKATQTKQMDIHIRYWDSNYQRVNTRYVTSVFMGHATADDMLSKMMDCFKINDIDKLKILQVSMDGPNVNWRFYNLLQQEINETGEDVPTLVNIGSCGLHVVHNAFKKGANESQWNVEDVLSSLHWLFVDSSARREDYTEITSNTVFPLKFCKHRWVENVPVALRAQHIWNNVKLYIEKVQTEKKYAVPKSKSFRVISDAVKDPLMPAKLAAFESIAKQLQPFLLLFQSDNPLVPFIVSILQQIIEGLMKRFVKADVLEKASSLVKLLKIDIDETKNLLDLKKIDIGFVATEVLKKLQGEKVISDRQVCYCYIIQKLMHN